MRDVGNSNRNGHSLYDRLLDEPDIRELHNDEHALDNAGLAFENAHLGDSAFP